ncbi:hypothetical protein B0J13DRAFT_620972 [Dactylonectria estremocensis]|uniref:Uncharacterized protein n=1 Tax=Dactylonectria estremocensis TaxID=1079267 RepID=A0A9P9F0P6_9HYPO|nr:hypothetical protein B0J13DRAFT_620972 [Dactylonectria estremocensis]
MASTSQSHYYYDPNAYTWVQPTIIEDDDLTFGGKSLSTWYEEERRRLSSGSGSEDGEERRGHFDIYDAVMPYPKVGGEHPRWCRDKMLFPEIALSAMNDDAPILAGELE